MQSKVKKIAKVAYKTVKWFFIVFLLYIGSLWFHEERLPRWCVDRICDRLGGESAVVHCENATIGLRNGLKLESVRVFVKGAKRAAEPMMSAEVISIKHILRQVKISGLKVSRLHDAYYDPNANPGPKPVPEDITLPDLPQFTLILDHPEVLGVRPRKVVTEVKVDPRRIDVGDFVLFWPDLECPMSLTGAMSVDFDSMRIDGGVRGLATQRQIRPMIEVLDVGVALPYIDAFTGLTGPVKAGCEWGVDLRTGEFTLDLDLEPPMGAYRGIPMSLTKGGIRLRVMFPPGEPMAFEHVIGPITAADAKGLPLNGSISIHGTNGLIRLGFDAKSSLPLESIIPIAEYFSPETLSPFKCETPPTITITGLLATDVEYQRENDLKGEIAFARGSLFGAQLRNASCNYSYCGDTVIFTNATATCGRGGKIDGHAAIHVPGLDQDRDWFSLALKYRGGSLAELAEAAGMTMDERRGRIDADIEMTSQMSTNFVETLNGRGRVTISDGQLAQMRLFFGLTDFLADKVPGVAAIVNQSQASSDFTITNGVIASDNILIEGSLFSIKANGRYDMVKDDLDFTVMVQFLKNETLLGKLLHPVMWPFTKLLFEFKVGGKLSDPKWKYITLVDRVL